MTCWPAELEPSFPWYVSITSLIGPVKLVVKGRANLLQPSLLHHAKKLWCVSSSYFCEDSSLLWESFSFMELVNKPAAKHSSWKHPLQPILKVTAPHLDWHPNGGVISHTGFQCEYAREYCNMCVWFQRGICRNFFKSSGIYTSWSDIIFSFIFLKILFIYFLERGRRRKRGGETSMCGCLSHAPYWGPGLQPRHVP